MIWRFRRFENFSGNPCPEKALALAWRLVAASLPLGQPQREQKIQPIWEPQYGIPALHDLIRAIPEPSKESLTGSIEKEHKQLEQAQPTYQQWARQAQAIYQVVEPRDIDQRLAFLMQKEQQSPNQITQVLAQSPAVQELLRRSPTYTQSYSEFCQSSARDNQATWQAELDQYHRAMEIERQQQEQRRRAVELKQQQQLAATPRPTPDGSLEQVALQGNSTQKRRRSSLPQVTDFQLLAAERRVALYFQVAPINPTDQQLAFVTERHQKQLATAAAANQEYRRLEQELESASIVEQLLPGYREKKKEAAKLAARFIGEASEMERTQEKLNQLEQQRRTFSQWQTSPQTQEMERLRDYLNTKESQTRLKEIKAQQRSRSRQQKPEREMGRGFHL
ncbi:MAG: hypothetical protein JO235_01895 [Chroococcidiopsidaceae cyanobacterium CP_BM_RX_35]|nr:hypothetical protein [Chroococcidiopsidaceae cyanobacterium CP_BM_RX_35]